ncbi:MAG: sulfite exporter TauE/SafE family protein [Actinomycetota bacterium]
MDISMIVGLILLGLIAGTLASTLGVGGGIIFVPMLVAFFGFSQIEAQGTSLAIILPTALLSTVVHARAKRIHWGVATVAGIIGVPLALLGAKVALSLDQETLSKVFSVLLTVVAVRMGYRAWTLRPAASSPSIDRSGDSAGS